MGKVFKEVGLSSVYMRGRLPPIYSLQAAWSQLLASRDQISWTCSSARHLSDVRVYLVAAFDTRHLVRRSGQL